MNRKPREEDIAMSWCLKNGIKIYANPIDNTKVIIEFRQGLNPPKKGTKIYKSGNLGKGDEKWWEKIREMYVEIYNKHLESLNKKEE